ncbi:MAG: T9SS type A sorting domain-containing protein [Bacteroidales bacterium]|nr:T9SS type A sorting domain-containing protein [Bacteroidales bacterium]
MRRIFTLIVVLIACASQMFAQLVILNGQQGDENITNTTVNMTNEIYFRVKNTSSSEIANIKCYLRVSADENAAFGTDAEWEFCSTGCGLNGSCPKFTLAAGAEQLVHLEFSQVNAPCDFMIYTYPTGGNPTAVFTIHVTTTGISNVAANSFNVYPSPANESFTIENGFGKNSYVEIYNVLGQTVKRIPSDNANNISVNCSSWKNGYYVCRLYKDGKAEKTVKVVVAH